MGGVTGGKDSRATERVVRKALILDVSGLDNSYPAELLLSKGDEMIGWIPSTIPVFLDNIQHILN